MSELAKQLKASVGSSLKVKCPHCGGKIRIDDELNISGTHSDQEDDQGDQEADQGNDFFENLLR